MEGSLSSAANMHFSQQSETTPLIPKAKHDVEDEESSADSGNNVESTRDAKSVVGIISVLLIGKEPHSVYDASCYAAELETRRIHLTSRCLPGPCYVQQHRI